MHYNNVVIWQRFAHCLQATEAFNNLWTTAANLRELQTPEHSLDLGQGGGVKNQQEKLVKIKDIPNIGLRKKFTTDFAMLEAKELFKN